MLVPPLTFLFFLFLLSSSVIHISETGKGFVGFSLTEMSWGVAASARKKEKKLRGMTQTGAFTRSIEEMHGFSPSLHGPFIETSGITTLVKEGTVILHIIIILFEGLWWHKINSTE